MASSKTMKILSKLDRVAAWTLLLSTLLFLFSGYGMLKYLMNVELAKFIHDRILPIPFLVAFVMHSTWAVHLSLKRWKMWNAKTLYGLLITFAVILIGLALIHYGVIHGTPPVQSIDLG